MLFTTPDAGKYISGVILFDETIRQKAADGTGRWSRSMKSAPA